MPIPPPLRRRIVRQRRTITFCKASSIKGRWAGSQELEYQCLGLESAATLRRPYLLVKLRRRLHVRVCLLLLLQLRNQHVDRSKTLNRQRRRPYFPRLARPGLRSKRRSRLLAICARIRPRLRSPTQEALPRQPTISGKDTGSRRQQDCGQPAASTRSLASPTR